MIAGALTASFRRSRASLYPSRRAMKNGRRKRSASRQSRASARADPGCDAAEALDALGRGKTKRADALFAELESRAQPAIDLVAGTWSERARRLPGGALAEARRHSRRLIGSFGPYRVQLLGGTLPNCLGATPPPPNATKSFSAACGSEGRRCRGDGGSLSQPCLALLGAGPLAEAEPTRQASHSDRREATAG